MFMQINQKECLSRLLFSEFDRSFNGIVKCIRMFHNRVQNKVSSICLSLDRERENIYMCETRVYLFYSR